MSTYTLTYNTKLTEDFIHSDSILASPTAATPLATFVNANGQSEALVIKDTGELCHLQREPLSSSGWNIFGIGAEGQSVAAANSGNVWITDVEESIWQSNAGHWNLVGNVPGDGGLSGISVGRDGTIYAVTNENGNFHLFTYDSATGSFQDTGVVPIDEAPVGSAGSLWSISNQTVMVSAEAGVWEPMTGAFDAGDTPTFISVGIDGSVFVLCAASGAIYFFDIASRSWNKVAQAPQGLIDFEVLNLQTLYAVVQQGSTREIQSYSGGSWSTVASPPYSVADISIGSDGSFWCLDVSGTVWRNDSGNWIRQMIPTGLPGLTTSNTVTEVVTGLHSDGNQYAFYVMDGDLFCSMLDRSKSWGGVWTAGTPVFQGCCNLGVTYPPLTDNALMVYGVTTTGDFLMVQRQNDAWTAQQFSVAVEGSKSPFSLAGAKIQYAGLNALMWNLWCVVDNSLYNAFKVGNGLKSPPTELVPTSLSTPPATIIPFAQVPSAVIGLCTVILDTSGQIVFLTVDTTTGTNVITPLTWPGTPIGKVLSAVAMISNQSSKYITEGRIFAQDTNNSLWIIRFTADSQTEPGTFTWGQWHPLGNNCVFLANGPGNVPSTDLFMLDDGYEVNVLSEDLTNGVWNDLVMLKPAGTNSDCEYVTRYLTELTITDENSVPQSNCSVGVTADEAVGIWVGNTLYNVIPSAPVQLTTDRTGKITFGFFAADIHTPTFSFTADGLSSPPTICPAQAVNNYLAGQSGALPDKPDFDAAGKTLLGAQMQTQPEWSGSPTSLVEGANNQANAPAAAQAITQIYTIPLNPTGTSSQWQVALSQTGVGSTDFWGDLCSVGRDIEHAIKTGALKVTEVTVDVANKVVSFTMELANGLSQVLQLVLNTARDVANAVAAVFRYIERAIDEVIDWLKSLFKWHDVLNTKMVLETALNGLMSKLEENFDPNSPVYAATLFKMYFNDLVATIQDAFRQAESVFSQTQTFSSITSPVQYPAAAKPMGSDALHPTSVSNAQSSNGTHTNYVQTHTLNYVGQGGTFPPAAMGDGTSGDSLLQSLFSSIEANLSQAPYSTAQMQTISNLQSMFSDPKNFADVVIFDVINAIDKAVMLLLDLIESVVEALISLTGNALAGFQELLNRQIDIPVISWIYSEISDHPLTMLDLFCLTMAVPATLLYKLTFGLPGANPPFTDASAQAIVIQLSNPANFPWPAIASNQTVSARCKLLGDFPFPGAQFLMPGVSVFYALADALCDVTAYQNFQITPFPEALPPDPVDSFLSQLNIITSMASQWLTANYDLFDGQSSTAERMTLANWGLSFLPVASSLVFTMGSDHKATAEFNAKYGISLTCGIGLLLLAMGVATSLVQALDSEKAYGPFYWAQNIIAPIPTTLKPLITVEGQPQGVIACGVLVGADLVFDGANGALAFCEDWS